MTALIQKLLARRNIDQENDLMNTQHDCCEA
jgi:hypothetical protein